MHALLIIGLVGSLGAPPVPTVKEVTAHLDDLYRAKSAHARFSMTIKTKYIDRTLELESWSIGEEESLVVVRKPAREAGLATLRTKKGMWNYAPRADRLMRIPSGLLGESWMGSHFTNDDLMRESSWESDYTSTIKVVTEGGKEVLMITMIPKPEAAVVYTKVEMRLTREGWFPLRSDYYDEGDIVRTMHFKKIKAFGNRKIPTVMEVIPADKPNERTVVTYEDMVFDAKVESSLFTPRGLRRAARRR